MVWGNAAGELVEFKLANGFQCVEVARYYVPSLGWEGWRCELVFTEESSTEAKGLHRGRCGRTKERWWTTFRFKSQPT